ncbi:hypothetical protein N656DRAFT_781252 [Canariomyces notabilis]|uniref:Uncharacterized protein n=1 Tax=Canariomyces notabilis TaxID=2074819 RepID=A0AAN6QRC7_9PEZI|nr:hypothetical protein N656DRAFT_781252 [Canariomyces arenarius]
MELNETHSSSVFDRRTEGGIVVFNKNFRTITFSDNGFNVRFTVFGPDVSSQPRKLNKVTVGQFEFRLLSKPEVPSPTTRNTRCRRLHGQPPASRPQQVRSCEAASASSRAGRFPGTVRGARRRRHRGTVAGPTWPSSTATSTADAADCTSTCRSCRLPTPSSSSCGRTWSTTLSLSLGPGLRRCLQVLSTQV